MRKILAAALLAATPACAGTISLTCARPTGSYKVQVASTGAVTLLPAYGAPATFAGGGCADGTYSHSEHPEYSGTCSDQGGVVDDDLSEHDEHLNDD